MIISTSVEKMIEILQKQQYIYLEDLAQQVGWSSTDIERILKILERRGLIAVKYPLNLMQRPTVSLEGQVPALQPEEEPPFDKPISEYDLKVDGVPAHVIMGQRKGESRPYYFLMFPQIAPVTRMLLEKIRDEITEKIPLETQQVTDVSQTGLLRERFFATTRDVLKRYIPDLQQEKLETIGGIMLHELYGLGSLELVMGDDNLEDVALNSSVAPVGVYHRKYGWMRTNVRVRDEDEIFNFAAQIARKVGRQISTLDPILDAHLLSGDRVNATLYPISSKGNTITVRRFARDPWTIAHFLKKENSTLSSEMAAMLWQAIQYELNILVSGGTASGKTSMLNTMCALIPTHQRTVTIEDTRELTFPDSHWNWLPLLTREPNPEGLGEVDMLELLVSSLRMRPDRILLGEIRKKREAEVLFEAMHTGHAVYSTIHADTAGQTVRRLTQPPIEIPVVELEPLHLIVVQYRDRRKNLRRTLEIAEVTTGIKEGILSVNRLYSWRPRDDFFEKVNEPTKLIDSLNLHTGMTRTEILSDMNSKKKILEWMVAKDITNINHVGIIMDMYYSDEQRIAAAAEKGLTLQELLSG